MTRVLIVALSCCCILTAGAVRLPSALAQDQASEGRDASQEKTPYQLAAETPTAEKQARVEEILPRQRGAVTRVSTLLRDARRDRDILRANCLEQKVKLLTALLKISESAATQMSEAISKDDEQRTSQAYAKILVSSGRSKTILAEAEACVGATAVYSGTTDIEVEVEDGTRNHDPTLPASIPSNVNSPPVSSSF